MTSIEAKKLGELIRAARLDHGLSVRMLAEEIGINFSTISYLESGQIEHPSVDILKGLSKVLSLPLEDLYALAGYARKEGLPEFKVYLRSKYGLTVTDAAELEAHFRRLRNRKAKKRGTP